MAAQVHIPSPLLTLTKGKSEITVDGSDVKEILESLEKQFPGIKERLLDETGALRKFVNVYINEEDIRFLNGEDTEIKDGDDVSIIPAIAGGR